MQTKSSSLKRGLCDVFAVASFVSGFVFLSVVPLQMFNLDTASACAYIRHALTFLRPGGRLASVCMNTRHRREAFPDAQWIDLPANSFTESGTHVSASLILLTPEINGDL